MNTIYDVGDKVRLEAVFSGDPDSVSLEVRIGSYTVASYEYGTDPELVKAEAGRYYLDFVGEVPGYYQYIFTGSGAIQASGTDFFILKGA